MIRSHLTFILFFLLNALVSKVQAQDTLRLSNGDWLHGEIKSLNKSVLVMKTDFSEDDFRVKWDKVSELISGSHFTVFLSSRQKMYGSFQPPLQPGYALMVIQNGTMVEVPLNKIVYIDPVSESFAKRFKASISAGYTLTKANNSKQLLIRGTASYKSKNWKFSTNYNDTRSEQDDVDPIRRTDGSLNANYLFYKNWFAAFNNDFLSNTEQQIALRSTQTLALGNALVRTNKIYLSASTGLTFNREDYTNETEILNTREGFMGTEFNAYDIGDLSFLTKLAWYPSFTEKNRNRVNYSLDIKYDFPLDFFIKLGYTLNYDSRPPNNGTSRDYVFQTTLGWEF